MPPTCEVNTQQTMGVHVAHTASVKVWIAESRHDKRLT